MSFPRYPKYKDSGVEWLGEVPDEWGVKPLRYICNVRKGKLPGTTFSIPTAETDLPYLSMEYLRGELECTDYVSASKNIVCAESGDILLLWDGSNAGEFLRAKQGAVSSTVALIEPINIAQQFLFFACKSRERELKNQTIGMGIPHVSGDTLKSFAIPAPPFPEQIAIAEFLDRETGKIDGLVAEQRRLMELLKEKRQAVISHAVTKGLNPHAPMKPSGIEWLGDVPEDWEVMSLRRCKKRIQTGGTPPTADQSYYEDGTVPWFGPGSFDENLTVSEPIKWLNESAVKEGVARVFAAGATMIVTIGATLGKVSSLVEDGSCNQQITVIEFDPRRVCARFATYQIKRLEPALRAIAPSATLPILGLGEVADIDMVIPPLADQVAIVAHLDTELAKLDTLTAEAQRAIDLLQERRTALISAAVTGQIDVRNHAPKELGELSS